MMVKPETVSQISAVIEVMNEMDISTVERIMVLESAQGIYRAQMNAETQAVMMSNIMRKL